MQDASEMRQNQIVAAPLSIVLFQCPLTEFGDASVQGRIHHIENSSVHGDDPRVRGDGISKGGRPCMLVIDFTPTECRERSLGTLFVILLQIVLSNAISFSSTRVPPVLPAASCILRTSFLPILVVRYFLPGVKLFSKTVLTSYHVTNLIMYFKSLPSLLFKSLRRSTRFLFINCVIFLK